MDTNFINAEALFTEFLIEHVLPLAVEDYVGALFKRMFPDSKIAKNMHTCARRKSSNIVRYLEDTESLKIAEAMNFGQFGIATESSDYDDKKFYSVCLRDSDNEKGKVRVLFFHYQN